MIFKSHTLVTTKDVNLMYYKTLKVHYKILKVSYRNKTHLQFFQMS